MFMVLNTNQYRKRKKKWEKAYKHSNYFHKVFLGYLEMPSIIEIYGYVYVRLILNKDEKRVLLMINFINNRFIDD